MRLQLEIELTFSDKHLVPQNYCKHIAQKLQTSDNLSTGNDCTVIFSNLIQTILL